MSQKAGPHMIAPDQGSTFAGDAECRQGESAAGFSGTAVRRMPTIHCRPGWTEQQFDSTSVRDTTL